MRAKANQKSKLIDVVNVVGFDPGTNDGFGFSGLRIEDGKLYCVRSGTWFLKRDGFEGAGMQMLKLGNYIRDFFQVMMYDSIKTVCVYELNKFQAGKTAAAVNGAVIRKIMEECELYQIPYAGLEPSKARKHAFGNGSIKKKEIKSILEDMFEVEFDTENASDAAAVALGFVNQMGWI